MLSPDFVSISSIPFIFEVLADKAAAPLSGLMSYKVYSISEPRLHSSIFSPFISKE